MNLENLFAYENLTGLFESALPDFVLSFAFFTSLVYAVLGKRFEHQRSAITMSAAIGLALSIGLIWWEQANGYSIKDLGPMAIGFALLVLAFVMYQSVRMVGGSWAGAGITLGISMLIASILGLGVPIDAGIINSLMGAALIFGLMAFLLHQHGHLTPVHFPPISRGHGVAEVRRNMTDLYRDRCLSKRITKSMRQVRKEADLLNEHPERAGDVVLQIRRMLPAEGYLTERMAQLRAKAHRVREGHIARLAETKHVFRELPTEMKKKASLELVEGYKKMAGIDTRLERLDRAVAENERRIRELTRQAEVYSANHEFQKLNDCLRAAEKLQHHNSRLFGIIERTEVKLAAVAQKVAQEVQEVDNA
jgi:hypothetical protein